LPPLLWDAIPLGAVLGATAYVAWTRRPRRPAEVEDTIRSHARFRAALKDAATEAPAAGQQGPVQAPGASGHGDGKR
jgi:hypothetical protein